MLYDVNRTEEGSVMLETKLESSFTEDETSEIPEAP